MQIKDQTTKEEKPKTTETSEKEIDDITNQFQSQTIQSPNEPILLMSKPRMKNNNVKLEEKIDPNSIRLVLSDMTSHEMWFKVSRTSKMSSVMERYCQERKILLSKHRFLVDGARVQVFDTPESLELEDGDMVQVHYGQLGGRNSCGCIEYFG
ncbi:hypothetical protein KGF54_002730 [Candida jiufengensis]|uniref:uncharacterized protein n=1 Tax=Candida jiufengensis TaxID=497108 RepID=UPI002224C57A|nr:uncharacterized protein KGF54_002730 [Candida jiufengensis]KAI5953359.1 hypothetical protein KGF54_002730 [Candida jiufengensis]